MAEGVKTAANGGGFRFKVRGPRDFYGGLALIGARDLRDLGVAAICPACMALPSGREPRRACSPGCLRSVGALVALVRPAGRRSADRKLRGPRPGLGAARDPCIRRHDPRPQSGPRSSIPPLGLVPSTFAAFMVSIFGSTEMRWVESLIAAVAMTAFCVALFVYLLQLPFQLWPWILSRNEPS